MSRLRGLWNRAQSDDGISLVELLVAMAIGALLLSMVATFFVNTARATTAANSTRDAATVAGNVANSMSNAIRFSVQLETSTGLSSPVIKGTDKSVTLSTLIQSPDNTTTPSKVTFTVTDGGEVKEERWTATKNSANYWIFPTGAGAVRSLGGTVVAAKTGEKPPFVYLDAAGAEIIPSVAASTGTELSAAQLLKVASVRISVRIRSPKNTTGPVTFIDNTVGMPNLLYSGGDK
jgi:Tfp pilus assembly protein PilW